MERKAITEKPNMSFAEAYREMRNGKCIAHETFDGNFWVWENDTIMLHSASGLNYRFQDALDIGRLFDLVVEDKWHIVGLVGTYTTPKKHEKDEEDK